MEPEKRCSFKLHQASPDRVRGPGADWTCRSRLNEEWHQQSHQCKGAPENTVYLIKWSYHQVMGAVATVLLFRKYDMQSHFMMGGFFLPREKILTYSEIRTLSL